MEQVEPWSRRCYFNNWPGHPWIEKKNGLPPFAVAGDISCSPKSINEKALRRLGFGGRRWRWRDSNSCPNISFNSFLHAYFVLCFSGTDWKQTTDQFLSCIPGCPGLKQPAQPLVAASCFVLSRRRGLETSEPARRPKWLLNHWLGSHGILSIAI